MQEELKIGVITESITFLYLTAATNSQYLLTKQLKFRTRLDFIISNYSQFYFYQRRKCEKENTFFSNPNPLSVCVPKTHVIFVTWRNLISWTIKMVQIKKYHIVFWKAFSTAIVNNQLKLFAKDDRRFVYFRDILYFGLFCMRHLHFLLQKLIL